MSNATRKIAVIGGGISGLATAYFLMRQARQNRVGLDIHLYERSRTLGGNADTVVVDLGQRYGASGPEGRYLRWADLGVNDVNLATYTHLRALMETVGYLDQMRPIQDAKSFFSPDADIAYTDDESLTYGVSDPADNLAYVDQGRLQPLIQAIHDTAMRMVKNHEVGIDYTVGKFFQGCLDDPQCMLSAAAEAAHLDIDWNDPELPRRLVTARDQIYYPRISAMYFTDDRGPQGMPLQAPFEYYKLQEGGDPPERSYFNHGSQTWLDYLAGWLEGQADDQIRLDIRYETQVRVLVRDGAVAVADRDAPAEDYDWCVVTTHADDARQLLHFADSAADSGRRLDAILAGVRYTGSYAVCHTHSAILPPSKNVWRTYNVQIRPRGDTFTPYRIHCIVNLHQNDPVNPQYDHAGLPQYFVSLVDNLNSIPQQDMLDRVRDPSLLPPDFLAALPESTRRQMKEGEVDSGYLHKLAHVAEPLRDKAWTYFRHNVLDADCIRAQLAIKDYNLATATAALTAKPACPVLFAGGWTNGAGLHDQCVEQAENIGKWILPN